MRSVAPESVNVELQPVMIAKISPEELARLLPVEFHEMDPLAAPEPSLGAVVKLRSGRVAALSYGKETGQLTVEVEPAPEAAMALLELLLEAPIDVEAIGWVKPGLVPPVFKNRARIAELKKSVAKLNLRPAKEIDSLLAALADISAHSGAHGDTSALP